MTTPFVARQYSPRVQDYLSSTVHRQCADLDQIEVALKQTPAARLLDLSCGGGHPSHHAAPLVSEVVACELTASILDTVQATATAHGLTNVSVQQAPAEALPFDDASFDMVIARHTTHHWRQCEVGLREARRVLKPDGRAIFIDMIAPNDALLDICLQTLELLHDISHVRNYIMAKWTAALAAAGFAIDSLTPRKLLLHVDDWVARTRTSAAHIHAIGSLQLAGSDEVRRHFAIADDGSFTLDTLTLAAQAA
ncbi:MAG: class I SAM-dependent methyltransferase [Rhodanobacter sp.]